MIPSDPPPQAYTDVKNTAYFQWLDTFVKEGTSKIDTVAAAVTQLSRDVSPGVDQFGNPTGTLFDGLQILLAESRARDLTIHALQASVNTLFAAINERLPSGGANGTLSECCGGNPASRMFTKGSVL